jgi:hypothetical protein
MQFPETFPEDFRHLPGRFPAASRKISDSFPEDFRQLPGRFPTAFRKLSENFLEASQKLPGSLPGTAQELPGQSRGPAPVCWSQSLGPAILTPCFRSWNQVSRTQDLGSPGAGLTSQENACGTRCALSLIEIMYVKVTFSSLPVSMTL